MRNTHHPLHPFLYAKPPRSLMDEDAFMHEHGGKGSRAIFLTVEAIGMSFAYIGRMPAAILRLIGNHRPLEKVSASKKPSPPPRSAKGSRHPRVASQNCVDANASQNPPRRA